MPAPFRAPTPVQAASGPPWWLLAIVLIAVLWSLQGRGCAPVVPPPQPPAGPDLVSAFSTNDNRGEASAHAHLFATICASVAEYLEYDGTRPEPLIKTGVQIDELRRSLRQTRTKGWSFLPRYPELHGQLESFLTEQLGTAGGPIDATQRAKWVAAMRQLAACAEYAAKKG